MDSFRVIKWSIKSVDYCGLKGAIGKVLVDPLVYFYGNCCLTSGFSTLIYAPLKLFLK